jgi:hypothetical protein
MTDFGRRREGDILARLPCRRMAAGAVLAYHRALLSRAAFLGPLTAEDLTGLLAAYMASDTAGVDEVPDSCRAAAGSLLRMSRRRDPLGRLLAWPLEPHLGRSVDRRVLVPLFLAVEGLVGEPMAECRLLCGERLDSLVAALGPAEGWAALPDDEAAARAGRHCLARLAEAAPPDVERLSDRLASAVGLAVPPRLFGPDVARFVLAGWFGPECRVEWGEPPVAVEALRDQLSADR